MTEQDGKKDADAICRALKGADLGVYAKSLETLQRRPDLLAMAKPAIVDAMARAQGTEKFDLAFALASLGSRDPTVMESLAAASTPLNAFDALEPFCEAPRVDRVQATAKSPITGALVLDSMGNLFLSPEGDYRGGGMGAIRLVGWSHDAGGHRRGETLAVRGFFKAGVGLLVEEVMRPGAPQ